MKLRNFTPHEVMRFETATGIIEVPREGVARCQEHYEQLGFWDDEKQFPKYRVTYGEVTDLPEPQPGVVIIVSQLVVNACPNRDDLAYPSDFTRNNGEIYSFRKLVGLGMVKDGN